MNRMVFVREDREVVPGGGGGGGGGVCTYLHICIHNIYKNETYLYLSLCNVYVYTHT